MWTDGRRVKGWFVVLGWLVLVYPGDPKPGSARERQRGEAAEEPGTPNVEPGRVPLTPGQQLYSRHCAACHGATGDGKGPAAVFLYPKPRSFRGGMYRLVSTANNVPTRDDLNAVLARGMPGSSMPSWAHLTAADRNLMVDEVIRLTSEGARDRYASNLKEREQLTDEELQSPEVQDEITAYAEQQIMPGELTEVPSFQPADAAAIARGKQLYVRQSCHSCHGAEAKGDGVQKMVDDDGVATRSRDLTRGIYKGGHDVAALFRRIRYGMPGTPMPASNNLQPGEITDLVHFLRSLSTESQRESVVLRRGKIVVGRVVALPDSVSAASWHDVAEVAIQTFPLWWRDDAEADLHLRAVHDGQTLAVRMEWKDSSQNTSAVHPDEFEDMAAIQLWSGSNEPFLGMGTGEGQVDLWQWRAGTSATGAQDSLLDEYPFDTPVYRGFARGQPVPDFITGRAAGNPLAVREHNAANLVAKGLGSTTYRPRASQLVKADATWSNGRWTVVLRRPLVVPAGSGLALAADDPYSLAFALWDGAARDRGGQKLISIWNDFQLR